MDRAVIQTAYVNATSFTSQIVDKNTVRKYSTKTGGNTQT